ncbi:ABC transporter ATP-binding protein [Sinosporangium siamense]|uniref:ABC transporter ATP-binding protein n=1 Tax=Sinosporangium siamense TaxID=1367973 RepID=A0A919V811_9ACTN|nr:ABC transporter ATP-binding protein [Sinosporangium siamense]GII92702.1 ABC transporter ATP-binding protein [Sinosporangium siamense]
MKLLDVRDLTVSFPTKKGPVLAVDGLTYHVEPGEIISLVGESGCGKSVGILSLLGLQGPSARLSGSALFDGRELLHASEKHLSTIRGKQVACVFQDPMSSLNPVLTVGKQVAEVLRRHRGLSAAQAKKQVINLLERVGIPAPAQRYANYPHEMSGGMRQRVMIAMAVACEPRLLIADEPTTALDVTIQAGILELLKELRDETGMAVLLVTHDLGVVADIADRVIVMYAGRKVEEAEVRALFADPRHQYTRRLLDAIPRRGGGGDPGRRLSGIPGTVPTLHESPAACSFAGRCVVASEQCHTAKPPFTESAPGQAAACWHPGAQTGHAATGALK